MKKFAVLFTFELQTKCLHQKLMVSKLKGIIYCYTVQRSKGSGLRHDHLECVCLSVCAAVSSFVKFCNSSPSFISNYHARILFFAKFSRTSRSLFEQSLNKCSNGVCFYKLGCHFGKVFLLDRNLYDLKAVVSEASILKTSSR